MSLLSFVAYVSCNFLLLLRMCHCSVSATQHPRKRCQKSYHSLFCLWEVFAFMHSGCHCSVLGVMSCNFLLLLRMRHCSVSTTQHPRKRCQKSYHSLLQSVLSVQSSAELIKKAYDTAYSQAVTHPSTNAAQSCLTSVIGRELVFSTWYGRRHIQELSCF